MTRSVSFDRAADYYDRTRSSDDVVERLVPELARLLPQTELCLEIGIGTGRIALPLVEVGHRVVGVDISSEMLRKLLQKRSGSWPVVAMADATRLPFRDSNFGAAIAAHVLHLISDWRSAVEELRRVLHSGAVLAASRGDTSTDWHNAVRRRFFVEAGDRPWPPGLDTITQLDEHLVAQGATSLASIDMRRDHETSINEVLASFEDGIFAACWDLDEVTRRRAAASTRTWAEREIGDVDAKRRTFGGSTWRVYRLPEKR